MPVARGDFTVEMTGTPGGDHPTELFELVKDYTGDFVATSRGRMVSHRSPTPGSAGYVAIEVVAGALDGRTGSFALQHHGIMERGEGTLTIVVIPDSATGELAGLGGAMTIAIDDAGHHYELDYHLGNG